MSLTSGPTCRRFNAPAAEQPWRQWPAISSAPVTPTARHHSTALGVDLSSRAVSALSRMYPVAIKATLCDLGNGCVLWMRGDPEVKSGTGAEWEGLGGRGGCALAFFKGYTPRAARGESAKRRAHCC